MAWAADNAGWLQTGTPSAPEVWIFSTAMTGQGAAVFGMVDPAKPVGVRIYGSPLLDTCYEVITTGGTGANIVVRKVTNGTAGSALQTAAHGLTTGDNYTLQVRWNAGVITVYLNGSTTAILTHNTNGDLAYLSTIGFSTSTDLARVGSADLYLLTQTFSTLADVAWWVAGGTLYASDSGRGGARAIGTFFDPSARVIGAELRQQAFIVDGTSIVKFDAVTMTAELFQLTAGTMPGQSALNTPPGRTTAKVALSYNDRLLLLEGNIGKASRIGDETDMDTSAAADDTGKAFVLQTGGPGQVGEPLLGGYVAANNRLLLGARRSLYALSGDPVLGAELSRLSDDIGCTGPASFLGVSEGAALVHTDEGLVLVPPGGQPIYLSRDVLTTGIQVDNAADTAFVSMVRDIKRHGTWIFITPTSGSAGLHIFYDERTGRFNPEAGGFWPTVMGSTDADPTCAMRYQGDVVFGTRSGKMLFLDAAASDDNGTDFSHTLAVNMLRDDPGASNVLIYDFEIILGLGSDSVSITLAGGETPERAYDTSGWTLWTGTISQIRDSFYASVSAPAIVMKLSGTGTRYALESVTVEYGLEPLVKHSLRGAIAPSAPCGPDPAAPVDTDPGPDGGPGPGGDDGSSCVACATFMAANGDATVDGKTAYTLGSGTSIEAALAAAQTEYESFFASSNVCDIPSFSEVILRAHFEFAVGPETTLDELGNIDTLTNVSWPNSASPDNVPVYTVYVTCEDNAL